MEGLVVSQEQHQTASPLYGCKPGKESNIDTITLHIGVNDILQDSTLDNVINYIKNVQLMV